MPLQDRDELQRSRSGGIWRGHDLSRGEDFLDLFDRFLLSLKLLGLVKFLLLQSCRNFSLDSLVPTFY